MHVVAAWLSGNALVSIKVVALRRARLVLGWVTVRGLSILVFNQRPTQPGHPSMGRYNEYWQWSQPPLGKKQRVLRNSGPVPKLLAYWPSRLKALAVTGPAIRLTCVVC